MVTQVVDKFVLELEVQQRTKTSLLNSVKKLVNGLLGADIIKNLGRDPYRALFQEHIKKPLAEELLFGKLVKGGEVLVDIEKDS